MICASEKQKVLWVQKLINNFSIVSFDTFTQVILKHEKVKRSLNSHQLQDSGSCGFYFNNILLKFVEISKTCRNWISGNIQFLKSLYCI